MKSALKRTESRWLIREIVAVLLIKLVIIFAIKWIFFSDPVVINEAGQQLETHFGVATEPVKTAPTTGQ